MSVNVYAFALATTQTPEFKVKSLSGLSDTISRYKIFSRLSVNTFGRSRNKLPTKKLPKHQ